MGTLKGFIFKRCNDLLFLEYLVYILFYTGLFCKLVSLFKVCILAYITFLGFCTYVKNVFLLLVCEPSVKICIFICYKSVLSYLLCKKDGCLFNSFFNQ